MGASSFVPAPVGYCPQCGYDQRGLPADSACPECGARFHSGVVVSDINRWADGLRLHLWCDAIIMAVGWTSLIVAGVAGPRNVPGAVMLGMAGTVYLLCGWIWYYCLLISFVRRFRTAAYRNVTPRRSAGVRLWIVGNGLGAVLTMGWIAYLFSAI